MRLLALAALSRCCSAFVARAPAAARRRALAAGSARSSSSFAEFDGAPSRVGTQSLKWDKYAADVLPLWVADMDFAAPPCVVEALAARAAHGVYGYTTARAHAAEAEVLRYPSPRAHATRAGGLHPRG